MGGKPRLDMVEQRIESLMQRHMPDPLAAAIAGLTDAQIAHLRHVQETTDPAHFMAELMEISGYEPNTDKRLAQETGSADPEPGDS